MVEYTYTGLCYKCYLFILENLTQREILRVLQMNFSCITTTKFTVHPVLRFSLCFFLNSSSSHHLPSLLLIPFHFSVYGIYQPYSAPPPTLTNLTNLTSTTNPANDCLCPQTFSILRANMLPMGSILLQSLSLQIQSKVGHRSHHINNPAINPSLHPRKVQ